MKKFPLFFIFILSFTSIPSQAEDEICNSTIDNIKAAESGVVSVVFTSNGIKTESFNIGGQNMVSLAEKTFLTQSKVCYINSGINLVSFRLYK